MVMVDGIHLNWPSTHHRHNNDGKVDCNAARRTTSKSTRSSGSLARRKPTLPHRVARDRRASRRHAGLFDGSLCLYVHTNDARAITEAVHFKRDLGIERMAIVGGYDAYLVADLLRENDVAVMLQSVHSLPRFADDDVDLPFNCPSC